MSETPNRRIQVDLSGQSAIVTGASQGIGKSIALTLAAAGAKVACIARSKEKLAETAKAISDAGGTAAVYPCDVTDSAASQKVIEAVVAEWGQLDILVNNAGITRDTLIPRMSDEEWDDVIATNLRSVFIFTRGAIQEMMRKRSGRIINISSVSGIMGNPGQANYSASKAGIIGLTQTVAREIAGRKVTVNAICPGFISSEMTDAMGPVVQDEVKKRVPAKRLGEVEEIADAVLYLASASAAYLTGQTLVIDGGLTA
ncbi:3-oxoacyl-[acyl-carrier-protein] reductase [Bythopirellula polymerisocia]|uniref:3-oxoacyl-[acyl-carrier-protein] reductase n=1 Tax=Bythopirellula polymerisocia TaxID=2528003 RepID=A0A5C6CCW1_9BACT|nr:3-oxoacyl-[acyl-carrier-protein] reductase [Bythopirellula polymerisocia]TWU21962.1 3-oxoacyl-[acyl-carrier-protein] reductase FabG [Bythopirellula polymerisocia]